MPLSEVHPHIAEASITSPAGPSKTASADQDEFSHLLRWQHVAKDEEEIDLAAEDDSEDDEQYGLDDAAEEDQPDVQDDDGGGVPGPSSRTKLSSDAIAEIINERIEFYTNAWTLNKGVAREDEIDDDPDAIWDEAEASSKRLELVQKYEDEHAYLSHRLDRICEEILIYHSAGSNAVSQHLQPKPT